jgi:putative transposase
MEVMQTYKYKLKPTKEQANLLENWIGTCRYVYNLALDTKIQSYQKGVNVSKYDLMKQLTDLKEVEWIKSVPSQSLQNVIERLDFAYQKFFSGGGFPKWAKKGEYSSMLFKSVKATNTGFLLPKIGELKVFKDRMPKGVLKTATVIKESTGYFICVTFSSQSKNLYPAGDNQAVGIDMGISCFLVDSDGNFVDNPRHTKRYEKRLRVKNRALARKKKGSTGFIRVKSELNRLHTKIADVRKDFSHKISLKYVKENTLIVCEDLKVKNMVKFGNLSKSIADVSWSGFFDKLSYKSQLYEKTFVQVNPKFTSQKCNSCGHIAKENRLNQADFHCVSCGHRQNADFNAAKNILGEGIALNRQREAVACA